MCHVMQCGSEETDLEVKSHCCKALLSYYRSWGEQK